ncbi:MAG: SPOR domain-containing protein [Coxiellaceae bacterium]|nr:SPOR domain-containing protein [Coxiellaceae bacterium]
MIKDYAKLKQQQPAAKPPTRWLPLSLLALTALALLTGLIIQIHLHSRHQQAQQKSESTPATTNKVVAAKIQKPKPKPKPIVTEFEFYQLLSKKMEPLPNNQAASNQPSAANASPGDKYQLQTASLQNRLDAQRFARQLLTLGFKSDIQPFLHPDGTTWYRVIIGPIDTYANAKQTQAMLQAQHVDSLLSRSS